MKTAEELQTIVAALEEDVDRLTTKHEWSERCLRLQKEQLTIFADKYEEQRVRINAMDEAVSTALGSLHVIRATANQIKNFTSYFVESPHKLVKDMEKIMARRDIAHDALCADYRIENAKDRLK